MCINEAKLYINCPVRVIMPRHYIDGVYVLTGCLLRRKPTGEYYYQAEVADPNNRSVMITSLDVIYPLQYKL